MGAQCIKKLPFSCLPVSTSGITVPAQISADLDQRMQNIRTRLADAELQHPQKQKKDEQILLDVLGL